jgi:hypothetical protein
MKMYPDDWRDRLTTVVVIAASFAAVKMLWRVIGIHGFWPEILAVVVTIILVTVLGPLICRLLFRSSSGGPPEKEKKDEKN